MQPASDSLPPTSPYALGPDGRQTRILVVDDSLTNRQMLVLMLRQEGFKVLTAKDGLEAVDACRRLEPDLVLMDMNMPRMDGLEATRLIKAELGERLMPVVFVTATSDDDGLAACVAAGGDDFVNKPIRSTVLLARIEAQLRVGRLYREQYEQRRELAYYRDLQEKEQRVAKKIFAAIDRSEVLVAPTFRFRLSPMSAFNGDLLFAADTPTGKTHVLVGDFTGHGLAAAIGALPTSDIFFAMTAKGFGLPEIIGEVNNRLKSLLPTGMFLAVCAMEISPQDRAVSLWAGGIPDALLRRRGGGPIEHLPARNLPLGIVDADDLGHDMQRVSVEPGDRIYAYTDGLTEAENADGEQFGAERLEEALAGDGDERDGFDRILDSLDRFRGSHAQSDDLTLLQFEASAEVRVRAAPREARPSHGGRRSTEWRVGLRFNGDTFRSFDPRPVVTQLVMEVQGLHEHKDKLFTILSELFSNALEHGLLALDSAMKATPEGFARYYEEREARLGALDTGWIRLELRHMPSGRGGSLTVEVEDSGAGFDYAAWGRREADAGQFSGRGLALLHELCSEVVFHPPGNRVQVVYSW